ncbi:MULTISPECIES: mechanosensitive ion channel family protein [Sphingobacterium]|uniref:mechanosensitive ion channel family protein n=1 Tax=Sphingobacterium TaxID=28453 RepID=UPI0013DA5204|nr:MULTISPECIES: mechanosensitive ion channel family protein [unclassified Sphingobacterium]
MKKKIFLCLSFAFFVCVSFAQRDTAQASNDTLSNQLSTSFNKVSQLSAERYADSLKRNALQQEVNDLGENDLIKRKELLDELNALKRRDSLHEVRQRKQVDSLRSFVKGNPVVLANDTLFYIYTRQGSFSASDRAEAVSKRILRLTEDPLFIMDSIKIIAAEQTTDLIYNTSLLISISQEDALWEESTKEKLAAKIKLQIGNSIAAYQKANSWQVLLKEILLTFLVIGVVILLIKGVNRLFRSIGLKLQTYQGKVNKGIKIQNYELLTAQRKLRFFETLNNFLRWVVIVLVIYLALPVLFGIFPFTKDLSENLLSYIVSPLKKISLAVWDYIPNMITILVLIVVFHYLLRFLRFIKTEIERGKLNISGFYKDWANPTYQIVRVLLLAFMLVVIFPYLPGHDSDIFKGVSVFMGVLFTFGSAGALSNVVAGLVLTYMRAFKIGDRVRIGEVTGDVMEKTLLVTRVRTIQNEIISIPNSSVMGNHTTNYSEEASSNGLIINTTVTIGYDVPWRQVHELLIAAALDSEYIEQEPKPYVYQTSLDDYYVSYRINAFTKQANRQALIYSSLHANIQDHFNSAGVEIMSPHYKALRDGNATTTPVEYLPHDYKAPPFKTSSDDNS